MRQFLLVCALSALAIAGNADRPNKGVDALALAAYRARRDVLIQQQYVFPFVWPFLMPPRLGIGTGTKVPV